MLLLNGNATVTVCHSKTRDLPAVCRRADILVAAIGRAGMITPDYVKPGATVIDVGMNKITDPAEFQKFFAGDAKREAAFAKNGSTLMGDVDPKVAEVAGAHHARSRRSRSAHHRHADEQHGEGSQAAPRPESRNHRCTIVATRPAHNSRSRFSLGESRRSGYSPFHTHTGDGMNFTRRELLERCAAFGAVTLGYITAACRHSPPSGTRPKRNGSPLRSANWVRSTSGKLRTHP